MHCRSFRCVDVDCLPTDLLRVDSIEATARGNPRRSVNSGSLRAVVRVQNSSPHPWSRLRSRAASRARVWGGVLLPGLGTYLRFRSRVLTASRAIKERCNSSNPGDGITEQTNAFAQLCARYVPDKVMHDDQAVHHRK